MNHKHLILTLSFLGAATLLLGQVEKNTILLDGSVNTGLSFVEENSSFEFILMPQYGQFLTDKLVAGAGVNLGVITGGGSTLFIYGISPFGRYYLASDDKLNLFAGAGISFSVVSSESNSSSLFAANVLAGADFFLNENIAFEPVFSVGYIAPSEGDSYVGIGLSAGFQPFFSPADQASFFSAQPDFGQGALVIANSMGGLELDFQSGVTMLDFYLAPEIGYFITDQIAAGLILDLFITDFGENISETYFAVNPFGRYYLNTSSSPAWFLQAEAGLTGYNFKYGEYKNSDTGFNGFLGAGGDFFLTPVTAVEGLGGLGISSINGTTVVEICIKANIQLFHSPGSW